MMSENLINLWKKCHAFLNFRKNKSITQARTEGKEDVGSLRSWAMNCCMIRSYWVSVTSPASSCPSSTGPPRTRNLLRLFEPRAHSYPPRGSLPSAHPTFSKTWSRSRFWKLLFHKETYSCSAETSFLIFFLDFWPIKSRKRDNRKKQYFLDYFDGLVHIRNQKSIICYVVSGHYKCQFKCCPGMINSKFKFYSDGQNCRKT